MAPGKRPAAETFGHLNAATFKAQYALCLSGIECAMERLPNDPQTFRGLIEADLQRAARLIVKGQAALDPQIRIVMPQGGFRLTVTFPAENYGRFTVLRLLTLFMAWKQAISFTFASELTKPDAVVCIGVSQEERHACLARISREPQPLTAANFDEVEWLPDTAIDPALAGLLPSGAHAITAKDMAALEKWFGPRGWFPAAPIVSGEG